MARKAVRYLASNDKLIAIVTNLFLLVFQWFHLSIYLYSQPCTKIAVPPPCLRMLYLYGRVYLDAV